MCGFRDYKTKIGFKYGIFPQIEEDEKNKSLLNLAKKLMDTNPKKREDPKIILDQLK